MCLCLDVEVDFITAFSKLNYLSYVISFGLGIVSAGPKSNDFVY
jgi:hypothetical protein